MPGYTIAPERRPAGTLITRGRRIPRPVKIHLAVLAGYLIAGCIVNWNRTFYLFQQVIPYSRDSALFVWDFWWMKQSVLHLANPYHSGYQAAPVGVPLAFHTLLPLPGVLMTPVTLIFGPGASYNLLSVLAPGLACYAMYRAARAGRWGGGRGLPGQAGAIAAGALFGLSTMLTFNDWYELNLALGAACLPVALEAAVRLRRRPGPGQGIILGVVLGAALLVDQESSIMAAMVAGLALAPWLVRRGTPALAKLRSLGFAAVAFAVVASPQLVASLAQTRAGDASMPAAALAGDYVNSGASLQQMFAPSPRVGAFGLRALQMYYYHSGPASNTMVSYGWVLTALALLGLVIGWRRPGTRPLALLWAGATALALGTGIDLDRHLRLVPFAITFDHIRVSPVLPYTWLIRVPGLSSFREADRLTEIGLVGAALLAAAGVDWLCRRAAPALVMVSVLAVCEMGTAGIGLTPPVTMPLALPRADGPIAADHSRSIVVDIPLGVRGGVPVPGEGAAFDPEVQVQAAADGHPRTAAMISRLPPSVLARVKSYPFYHELFWLQEFRAQRRFRGGRLPRWVVDAAQLAADRRSALGMHIGWAIMWKSLPTVSDYLREVGFRFDYAADGTRVYRLGKGLPRSPVT